nr:sugar-binding domain-containing protein [Quadrisphaera sp. RL12-1S]
MRTCRVVQSLGRSQQADQRLAGREAARVLAGVLEPASRFGIASSRTMAPVLGFTALLPRPAVVVELLGSGRPGRRGGGGAGVGAEAAHLLGARHVDVPTPFVHRTAERAAVARRRHVVQEALEVGCRADVALFGAGSLQRFDGTGAHAPVAAQALAEAAQDGAVGHLLGFFVDRAGRHVPTGVDALRVGIGLDQLRGVPRRVLLARGPERAAVIGGAVAAGLVTDLVTDTAAAAAVLAAAARP